MQSKRVLEVSKTNVMEVNISITAMHSVMYVRLSQ
jgi:hypothetical protein